MPARCEREHECDPKGDVTECEARCEDSLSPRVARERREWVAEAEQCADGTVAKGLTATSSWGMVSFAGLSPGTVELTAGLQVVCTPFQ